MAILLRIFSDGRPPNDHAIFVPRWRSGNLGHPLRFRLEHTPGVCPIAGLMAERRRSSRLI
jgi:hypothetical protein